MEKYWEAFLNGYAGYASYFWQEITVGYSYKPLWQNYFYWLIVVSLFFLVLEWARPWRVEQPKFRKDFWLDVFYMFFNFFLFSLIIFNAASSVVVTLFNDALLQFTGFDLQKANPLQYFPHWAILLIGFVVRDFVQWWTHRLLHYSPVLWEFHKVHHSVEQMGFAAHLRYHWMETVVYRFIEYLPLALLGIGLHDFFVIHLFTLAVGHYNHSNIYVGGQLTGSIVGALLGLLVASSYPDWGNWQVAAAVGGGAAVMGLGLGRWMPYLFNSPNMHIWHHAHDMPAEHPHGINFGISLAIWDYIFGTAVIPHNGRDIRLGFPGIEQFPKDFLKQSFYGFRTARK